MTGAAAVALVDVRAGVAAGDAVAGRVVGLAVTGRELVVGGAAVPQALAIAQISSVVAIRVGNVLVVIEIISCGAPPGSVKK